MQQNLRNPKSRGQTTVETVMMIAVSVALAVLVGRTFIRPAFKRALRIWDTQTGDALKGRLKQRWY